MATEDKGQEELLDYEEDEEALVDAKGDGDDGGAKDGAGAAGAKKGHYVGIHASGFRDFLLKPELLRAVVDCGFEHPSEVQHECIPQAILGVDIVCQAKSGMGKTAVFVLATLHQLNPQPGEVSCLVLCHTRELAWQIAREYERFCKHLPEVKVMVIYGGLPVQKQRETLKNDTPHIVVGCPGRVMQLVREGDLKVDKLQYFVLDECDKMLDQKDMRAQVQEIFFKTPHTKQVMMFSATLSPEVRPICRKFCHEKVRVKRARQRETKRALRKKRKNVKICLRPIWCIRRRCRPSLMVDAGKAWLWLRCPAPGFPTPLTPLRYKYTFFFPPPPFFFIESFKFLKQPPSYSGGKEAGDHIDTCA